MRGPFHRSAATLDRISFIRRSTDGFYRRLIESTTRAVTHDAIHSPGGAPGAGVGGGRNVSISARNLLIYDSADGG